MAIEAFWAFSVQCFGNVMLLGMFKDLIDAVLPMPADPNDD
jgi:hypothetical protein